MQQRSTYFLLASLLCLGLVLSEDVSLEEQLPASDEEIKVLPRFFNPIVTIQNYTYFIGINQRVNWFKAAEVCAFQGMSLAAIKTGREQELLVKYLQENDIFNGNYWIGASSLSVSGDFYWLADGTRLTFTNWESGVAPSAARDGCVYTSGRFFTWNIAYCKAVNHFLCQRPVVPYCSVSGTCRQRGENVFY